MEYLAWFLFWFVAMSFVEHFAHRHLMHRQGWLHRWSPKVYDRHAILHHRTYFKVFNDEPDEFGRNVNIEFEFLPSGPIALVMAAAVWPLSHASSWMVLAAVTAHHLIWNLIHAEMHNPRGRFFSEWPLYRILARYHWMHHRYPGKNYNVVVPLADFVWGTFLMASARDISQMEQIGL